MEEVILRSYKIGLDVKRLNYDTPIRECKREFSDGVFLVDSLTGTIFAKEIQPGIYQSLRLSNHFMYEEAVEWI